MLQIYEKIAEKIAHKRVFLTFLSLLLLTSTLAFAQSGNKITINAGYSHPVVMEAPAGLSVTSESNTEITIHGIDKQKVSEFAANVRKVREPEPYKGKGIRYKGEHVRRKEGKKAA